MDARLLNARYLNDLFDDEAIVKRHGFAPSGDRNKLQKLLDEFQISPDKLEPLFNEIWLIRWKIYQDWMREWDQIGQQTQNELFQIKKAVNEIEAGIITEIEFKIITKKHHLKPQTVSINSPKVLADIYKVLKGLPPGKLTTKNPGNPGNPRKKELYKSAMEKCLSFLETHTSEVWQITDKKFFCALIFSYVGIIKTPNQLGEATKDWRKKFTDQLNYYK